METLPQKLGVLCVIAFCLVAGCKSAGSDKGNSRIAPERITITIEPTNAIPKLKVPVEVQVDAQATNEVRLPVNVQVEAASKTPLSVAVAVTNDAATPMILPVTLRGDTNGIPLNLVAPRTDNSSYWYDVLVKVILLIGGALLAYYFWRKQKRIEFTVGFSEKYHSTDMIAARKRAWKYLSNTFQTDEATGAVTKRSGKEKDKVKMSDIAKETVSTESCSQCNSSLETGSLGDVLIVLHYFERIAVMGKDAHDKLFNSSHCMVDRKMVREHLGYEFLFWYQYIKHLRDDELSNEGGPWDNTQREWEASQSSWKELFWNIEASASWLIPNQAKLCDYYKAGCSVKGTAGNNSQTTPPTSTPATSAAPTSSKFQKLLGVIGILVALLVWGAEKYASNIESQIALVREIRGEYELQQRLDSVVNLQQAMAVRIYRFRADTYFDKIGANTTNLAARLKQGAYHLKHLPELYESYLAAIHQKHGWVEDFPYRADILDYEVDQDQRWSTYWSRKRGKSEFNITLITNATTTKDVISNLRALNARIHKAQSDLFLSTDQEDLRMNIGSIIGTNKIETLPDEQAIEVHKMLQKYLVKIQGDHEQVAAWNDGVNAEVFKSINEFEVRHYRNANIARGVFWFMLALFVVGTIIAIIEKINEKPTATGGERGAPHQQGQFSSSLSPPNHDKLGFPKGLWLKLKASVHDVLKTSKGPIFFSVLWIAVCAGCLLITKLHKGKARWNYEDYADWRTTLGIPFALFAIVCLFWFWKWNVLTSKSGRSTFNDWTTAIVAFWTLFPPIWFFMEYMAIEFKIFYNAPCLDVVQAYSDFASKIWAAFLAIYVALLAQRHQAAEAANKKN